MLPGALLENFLRKSWAASDYESDLLVGGQLRPHPKFFVYLMIKRYTAKKSYLPRPLRLYSAAQAGEHRFLAVWMPLLAETRTRTVSWIRNSSQPPALDEDEDIRVSANRELSCKGGLWPMTREGSLPSCVYGQC